MNKRIVLLTGAFVVSTATNIFITKVLRDTIQQKDLFKDALEWEVRQSRLEREYGWRSTGVNRVSLVNRDLGDENDFKSRRIERG